MLGSSLKCCQGRVLSAVVQQFCTLNQAISTAYTTNLFDFAYASVASICFTPVLCNTCTLHQAQPMGIHCCLISYSARCDQPLLGKCSPITSYAITGYRGCLKLQQVVWCHTPAEVGCKCLMMWYSLLLGLHQHNMQQIGVLCATCSC